MYRLWPVNSPEAALDDSQLRAAYAVEGEVLRVNFVTSIDGNVAPEGGSDALADSADRRLLKLLRDSSDAVFVGAGTLRTENYQALIGTEARRSARLAAGLARWPVLVVATEIGTGLATHQALVNAPVRPIVLTRQNSPASKDKVLAEVADVVAVGVNQLDLAAGLTKLRARGLRHVLCEGGPQLFGDLLALGLVDELCLTMAPRLTSAPHHCLHSVRLASQQLKLRGVVAAQSTVMLRYGLNPAS